MDSMAVHQQAAYDRLYRYVRTACKDALDTPSPDVPPELARALRALQGELVARLLRLLPRSSLAFFFPLSPPAPAVPARSRRLLLCPVLYGRGGAGAQ